MINRKYLVYIVTFVSITFVRCKSQTESGEWLDKLNVPKSADWAFSILKPGEGDPIPE